jgi:hypothetical protein
MPRCSAACRSSISTAVALTCWLGAVAAQDADESIGPARIRAQETGEPASRGQMSLTYQYQRAKGLYTSQFTVPGAPTTTHLIDFDVSYRIGNRWTVNAGLPLISREWKGGPSHDPMRIVPPHPESDFVDDGHFHTYLQDLRFGASYRVIDEPIGFVPYIEFGVPASDYPFFGASAPGRHMQTIEIGSELAYRPPFLKWYFGLRAGYVMSDEVLGYETDAMRVTAQAAYFIGPRLTLNAFLVSKNGKGGDPPAMPDTSEAWYLHDRYLRHNYANLGVGVDWALGDRNVLNVTTLKMVHLEDVFKLRRALSVTLSRSF